ncbi:MAG: glutamate synthase subunit beta [Candidatus Thiodiazotropha sp. (ex Lucinoma aequizonata)]|nr:glutamate synthase subunit beta [Candidatus Thiodiazotropha sp. (ex Lucinoma aequizonata)]MCU7887202.1 glutamate synthase subunit beta [Candidatus Thiodiazotropha sp. (ex Lucinoma aequizonata)]MCU7894349.1 glutamate synthase subunit beta [Candidatus Thiodiazotropha sp. (ex Lucinoma aequizonata)]MCU7899419.1 glutamate synthase subunit beta [Candidatus Thiodiazotropha sp. (ex Lucinoma aequizonata)]MCU7904170.1 glutamate synthase subunit beta [Candidatus Thiodiazotropha sp. (ex Lucinoma aequizo
MGKITGFKETTRQDRTYAPVADRIVNYNEFVIPLTDDNVSQQGARCMDCGIPFCHSECPVNNIIPDWNDLVYRGDWRSAIDVLHSTNNFPEFTGRICPAPCEAACTLNLDDQPVTIKTIEFSIIEKAWSEGWVKPKIADHKSGKRVAVIGSGPAGMAAAQQLARAGHEVVLFEKQNRIGGLLRYGIPDFKLDKKVIDRRMAQMRTEGVEFRTSIHIGADVPAKQLVERFDAVVLTGGAEKPRDLPMPGRELNGVHFAMDFLRSNSHRVQGDQVDDFISAEGKHVVVIGGGDTGSDCIGTSNRHGAASVTQLEILPKPPKKEEKGLTWPEWPNKMRTSSSQEEGCERMWQVATKAFLDNSNGNLAVVRCIKVEWEKDESGKWKMHEVAESEFEIKADLVTLAMGFVHPVHEGLLEELGIELDARGNVKSATEGAGAYKTSIDGVFTAGDMRRGQSLVVWAIREGRKAAWAVDEYLMGSTDLPLW